MALAPGVGIGANDAPRAAVASDLGGCVSAIVGDHQQLGDPRRFGA